MSVYIDMEMPTSCRKCKLMMNCDNCEGWECYCLPLGKNIGYMDDDPGIPSEKRRDDCPLVPVPPHGDLIDAQEQMRLMQSSDYDTYDDYSRAFDLLDNAPTIIPADPAYREETE